MKDALQALLRPQLFLQISGSGELKVKETDRSAVLKTLVITRVPNDSVAFELDHEPTGDLKRKLKSAFKQLSCLINSEHTKANKSCDFVIVTPGEHRAKIILGDLKSLSPKRSSCAAQLRNSEIFVEYLLRLIEEYHGKLIVPEFKKVVFFVAPPINSKAPTQQKNRTAAAIYNDVSYFPVTVGGRNNSQSFVAYPSFS